MDQFSPNYKSSLVLGMLVISRGPHVELGNINSGYKQCGVRFAHLAMWRGARFDHRARFDRPAVGLAVKFAYCGTAC